MDRTTYNLLHTLWTKAVGTPGYDKREWLQLEATLIQLSSARVLDFKKVPPTT